MGGDAMTVEQAERGEQETARADRAEADGTGGKSGKGCVQGRLCDGGQERVPFCSGNQDCVCFSRPQIRNCPRVNGDAAAAFDDAAFGRDQRDRVEYGLPLLVEHAIGAVEDRGRSRHIEQFEPRIDDEYDMVHWQKVAPI